MKKPTSTLNLNRRKLLKTAAKCGWIVAIVLSVIGDLSASSDPAEAARALARHG
jgi:hypothetical protein